MTTMTMTADTMTSTTNLSTSMVFSLYVGQDVDLAFAFSASMFSNAGLSVAVTKDRSSCGVRAVLVSASLSAGALERAAGLRASMEASGIAPADAARHAVEQVFVDALGQYLDVFTHEISIACHGADIVGEMIEDAQDMADPYYDDGNDWDAQDAEDEFADMLAGRTSIRSALDEMAETLEEMWERRCMTRR